MGGFELEARFGGKFGAGFLELLCESFDCLEKSAFVRRDLAEAYSHLRVSSLIISWKEISCVGDLAVESSNSSKAMVCSIFSLNTSEIMKLAHLILEF